MARKTKSPETRIKELGLELQFAQADWIDDYRFWMKRGGGVIVVGYLVNDRDCDNPLENCDAMGKIITKHDDKYFYSLVGCNEYGQPDTDEFIDMIQRLNGGEPVIGEISAAEKMWEEARKQGKIGARYAQPLRERYNSGYELATLTDLNRLNLDAVWIPDKALLDHIASFPEDERAAEAHKCFEEALELFNTWAEGECYGVCIDVFRRAGDYYTYKLDEKNSDACWGFVGNDHASESLTEEFESMKASLKMTPLLRPKTAVATAVVLTDRVQT